MKKSLLLICLLTLSLAMSACGKKEDKEAAAADAAVTAEAPEEKDQPAPAEAEPVAEGGDRLLVGIYIPDQCLHGFHRDERLQTPEHRLDDIRKLCRERMIDHGCDSL